MDCFIPILTSKKFQIINMKKSYCFREPCLSFFQIIGFLLLTCSLQAQIEVSGGNQNPWTPQNLIENVFLGDGVEVSNITYNGDDASVGYFQNGLADIGMERGIVMASGWAVGALGPNNASGNSAGPVVSNANCPELGQLTTFGLNDVATYSITFVPVSDTLRFRYVFASEEYPEYACSGFNDVFGFFISGSNPNGGTYTAENIALIPDLADPTGFTFTNLPVTINNVNGGVGANGNINNCTPPNGTLDYADYYNDNTGSTTLQYDGYLDVFTAQAIVVPCETYTIKLAVADAGDGAFDTAVFLEAKSFGTGKLEVTASTVSLDGTLVEGCADGDLCFEIPNEAESDFFLDYNIIGSAINGVDYETIPLDLFIAAGDSVVCFPIIPIEDGILEGIDSLGVDVQIDPCNRDTFWVYIKDADLPELVLPNDTMICKGDSVYLDGTLDIVLPIPPAFSNTTTYPIAPTNTPVYSDIFVSGVFPINLQEGVVKQVCIDSLTHKWDDDLDIFLFAPGGQFIELSTDNGANGDNYIGTCFSPSSTNAINVGPNNQAPASAAPFTGTYSPEGLFEDLWGGDSPTNGIWRLFALDDSNGFAGELQGWSICFEPLYQLAHSWSPAAGLSCADCPDPWATPDTTTTYVLTVTDTYGCSTQDSMTIMVEDILPAPMVDCGTISANSITFTWNDVGGATGGYQVNVDGTGWVLANGVLSQTVSGLALNQTVTIEVQGIADCNGEIGTQTCMTPDCPAPSGLISNVIDNNCFGENVGSATITGTGANPPFTYSLDGTIDADGILTDLLAGNYTVLVIDNVNCSIGVDFTIEESDSLVSVDVVIDNLSCNGLSDGEGTISVSGGTFPYNYLWSTGSTDSIATGLILGENYVTITDFNGCETFDTLEIIQPDLLSVSIGADSINCFAGIDGNAIATPVGGTPLPSGNYTYLWSDSQDDAIANNLSAQTYSVTVTDANGCTASASVTMEEYDELNLSLTSSTLASCNGVQDGTATIDPSGGAGGYIYAWQVLGNQTTQTAVGLTVGTYTVVVTDQLGCVDSTTVAVSSPNQIVAGFNSTPALCYDSADGQVVVNAAGGTPDPSLPEGYTFAWSVAGGNGSMHSGLPSGIHFVTITDVNNCFEVLEVEVFAPAEIILSLAASNVNCGSGSDGDATVTVTSGGAGGFMYQWSDGTNSTNSIVTELAVGWVYVTVEDANGCTAADSILLSSPDAIVLGSDFSAVDCNGNNAGTATVLPSSGAGGFTYLWDTNANNQITATAIDLEAGTYMVTVTDANMCTETIEIEVTEPTILTTSISGNDASCFGDANGNSTVVPDGGALDYTYLWSDGSNQTTAMADGLVAQLTPYFVTVTDGNGCTAVDQVMIGSPTELTLSIDGIDVSCFEGNDGSATATAGGGADNFTYLWSDANAQTTQFANGLAANNYSVTVTDNNGCTIAELVEIIELDELIITENQITNVGCNGNNSGAIDVSVTGGTSGYTYSWSNNDASQDITNLAIGTYTLTVTDANFCQAFATYSINEPAQLQISITNNEIVCFNGTEGEIDLTIIGGTTGTYDVSWTGPNGFNSAEEDLTGLIGGDYTITIVDPNGCTISQSITIAQPDAPLLATADSDDVVCYGGFDGKIYLFPTGGTAPYTYSTDGENFNGSPTQIGLIAGEYTNVTVMDGNGCKTLVPPVFVSEPDEVGVFLGPDTTIIYGQGIDLVPEIFNTSGNLTYTWTPDNDENISCLDCREPYIDSLSNQTSFQLSVTDENGCTSYDVITIFVKKLREVLVPTGFSPNADGNVNDLLLVHGREGTTIKIFRVYDRWGELVFENKDFPINSTLLTDDGGWDGSFEGKEMNPGVFVWYVEAEFEDGATEVFKGQTTLIK
jgi:gliding motility-associated-like protein